MNKIDYDIHGIVGIRLINPTQTDADFIDDKLNKFRKNLERDPDIVFSFKENLDLGPFNYLGLDALFTEDSFYAVSKKENLKIKIPFDTIGDKSEFIVESGSYDIPWLFDIINLTFLKKKFIPMHSTAFMMNNSGIMVIGWSKGGKTESLMAFANHNAHYVGDEWIMLSGDGSKMYGIPVPICLWEWQFEHIPKLLPKIGIQRKILFKGIHFLNYIHKLIKKSALERSFIASIFNKALPPFNKQLNIRVTPEKIFQERQKSSANLDKIILSFSHNSHDYKLIESDYKELAKHAFYSNTYEQSEFLNMYRAYKFAFPEGKNDFLENINEFQYSLIMEAFKNKETYKFFHPYPLKFEDMYSHLKHLADNN
ncbi:MAG: hypothetical protein H6627_07720 [Calditrichae bacterium]|nr:hypothetical protein [Leptospiraceae bacterium]MCB9058439.1 hypothetical protein [Calditrichia bacterium]